MQRVDSVLSSLDHMQQRRRWLAFPFAVVKKFGDDRAGRLAALIAYYGIFSLFPLLLAFVTALGFVLRGNDRLRDQIVDSALAQFPVIGPQIRENVGALQGNGFVLAIGLVGALWSGLGVVRTAQAAMDDVWNVPDARRRGFLPSVLRALLMLVVFGLAVVLSALLVSVGTAAELAPAVRVLVVLASVSVNLLLFAAAFRLLTTADVAWRAVIPGAVVAALAWALLQVIGAYFVDRILRNASEIYGFFAVVIGLLSWIYLAAQVMLFSAEINVVRERKLWPRSLFQDKGQE